jgi:hypothetical protein
MQTCTLAHGQGGIFNKPTSSTPRALACSTWDTCVALRRRGWGFSLGCFLVLAAVAHVVPLLPT